MFTFIFQVKRALSLQDVMKDIALDIKGIEVYFRARKQ